MIVTLFDEIETTTFTTSTRDRDTIIGKSVVSLNRCWNASIGLLVLKHDTEEDSYVLLGKDATVVYNEITCSEEIEIARFFCKEKKLVLTEEFNNIGTYKTNIASSYPAMKFLAIAMNMHANTIAGPKVFQMIRAMNLSNDGYVNALKYYDMVQQVEKLGDKLITTINNKDFELTDASKRHQVCKVPKQVMDYIDNLKIEAGSYRSAEMPSRYLAAFQSCMGEDPNEVIALIDYFNVVEELMKKIPSKQSSWYSSAAAPGDALEYLTRLGEVRAKHPDIDLRKLNQYLIKQQFMQLFEKPYWSRGNANPIRFAVTIPSFMAKIYVDYLNMKPTNLFPQDLYKSHNALSQECKITISDDDATRFAEYGAMLSARYNMQVGEYSFVVPTDYEKFVEIGKTFMNCLPTCGPAFMNGYCDIVFIYGKDEKIPKYVLELRDTTIIQAKTIHDLDITDEVIIDTIDKYVNKLADN